MMYDTKSDTPYRLVLPEDEDRKQDDPPDLQFLNLLKPVAHFSGLDFDEGTQGERGNLSVTRNWANPDGSDRKLLYNGMSYENGSITVPAAGVYHITSHVKFYVEDNKRDKKPLQTFQHQVVRYSASSQTQVVLFENAVTECKEGINDGAHLEYPSDAGGLAQLDAGDQVMVKVSHLHLLKHDRDWHSFDICLI
ncbi:tumor necrosis factor-like isoform X2 [Haliotis rufescens]|uniref:tumor necrosis factor-like isoform X2 n=1 Tax=Haliotis rufescens TaxID=6454 RepID=UPI00201E7D9E|nr:tumor necrosis factor-like isoform X2 [Haliotis rufescens]